MKNNNIYWGIISIFLLCNILITQYTLSFYHKTERLIEQISMHKNIESELIISTIESEALYRYLPRIDSTMHGQYVVVFPNNVCGTCNDSFLKELAIYSKNERINAVGPNRSIKTISYYSKKYGIDFNYIYHSNNYLLKDDLHKDAIYCFYCTKDGMILYPRIIRNNLISFKSYIETIRMIDPDFQQIE